MKKGNVAIALVIILFIIAVAVTYLTKDRKKTPTISPSAASTSNVAKATTVAPTISPTQTITPTPEIDPETGWRIYRGKQFVFRFPKDWNFDGHDSGEKQGTFIQIWPGPAREIKYRENEPIPTSDIYIEIGGNENDKNLTPQEYLIDTDKEGLSPKRYDIKPITINGISGIKYSWTHGARSGNTILLPHGKKMYAINAQPSDSEYKTELNQILSTFKFTGEEK